MKMNQKRKLECTNNIKVRFSQKIIIVVHSCFLIMQGNNGPSYRVILHDNFEGYIATNICISKPCLRGTNCRMIKSLGMKTLRVASLAIYDLRP